MGNQDYVGQYFINDIEHGGWCKRDTGECVWQDSQNLLCAHYESGTSGKKFHSILLIPVCLARKIKWYMTFDEFYEAIFGHSNCRPEITMTSEDRDAVQSMKVLPDYNSNIPWSSDFKHAGTCVARLARLLKERPPAGKILAEYISAEAAKCKAREAIIESIAKMIAGAGLSWDERHQLGLAQMDDDWPRGCGGSGEYEE